VSGPLLVTGAGGLLGGALAALPWALGLRRSQLDITDVDALHAALDEHRPVAVINAAAFARVDAAEQAPAEAHAVNAAAPAALAQACRRRGLRLVHLATDYVLRGPPHPGHLLTEDAAPEPVGVYAQSKAAGEAAVRAAGGVVLRVQWLYAPVGTSFFARALAGLRAGATLRLVPDQIGCPTPAALLARWIGRVAAGGPTGLFHLATTGEASPVEWLSAAADQLGLPLRWEPLPRAAIGPVPRPARSCLDGARARAAFGLPAVPWEEALRGALQAGEGQEPPGGAEGAAQRSD
jgi:dTDP-4-dehydrorhamnose reductase